MLKKKIILTLIQRHYYAQSRQGHRPTPSASFHQCLSRVIQESYSSFWSRCWKTETASILSTAWTLWSRSCPPTASVQRTPPSTGNKIAEQRRQSSPECWVKWTFWLLTWSPPNWKLVQHCGLTNCRTLPCKDPLKWGWAFINFVWKHSCRQNIGSRYLVAHYHNVLCLGIHLIGE